MSKETGGPAFPCVEYVQPAGSGASVMTIVGGMTLRDYFAAKAMAICPLLNATDKAEWAYKMADAMLKSREQ